MWNQWMDKEVTRAGWLVNTPKDCKDATKCVSISRELLYALDRLQVTRLKPSSSPRAHIQRLRRQIENKPQPSGQRFTDSLPVGLMVIDKRMRVVEMNRAAECLTGQKEDDCLGEPCEEVLRCDLCGRDCPMSRAMSSGSVCGPTEGSFYDAKGRNLPIEYTAAPLMDRQGIVVGGITLLSDISQRRALEKERIALLSMLVHDMKNHLLNIDNYAHLVMMPDIDRATSHEKSAAAILQESRRLERLVQDFLFAARMELRDIQLDLQVCDLYQLLQDLAEEYSENYRSTGHQLILQLPAEQLIVNLDRERMKQALENLLDNALHHSPPGAPVILRARKAGDFQCAVEVEDQGAGIHPDDLPHIFRPFFRGRKMQPYSGDGLGLAGVKAIVDGHGGAISARSNSKGGALFSISLPMEQRQLHEAS